MGFYTRYLNLRNIILAASSLTIAQAAPIDEPTPVIRGGFTPTATPVFSQESDGAKHNRNTKKVGDLFQEGGLKYIIIDSVANSLTMENDVQEPFTYEPETGELGLILRGFYNPNDPGHSPENSKNSIFIRTSRDVGASWSDPVRVYSYQDFNSYGGRYPSINSFNKNDETIYAFTFSLVDEEQGEWHGFLTGLYGPNLGNGFARSEDFKVGNKTYNWGGRGLDEDNKVIVVPSESKILGSLTDNGSSLSLAVGGVMPVGAGIDTLDNNYIGFRRTVELESEVIDSYIPPQMVNSIFRPVKTQFERTQTIVALRKDASEKYYLGVFGNFAAEENEKKAELAFSTSTDQGLTWSDFTVMPSSLIGDFAEQQGIPRDSAFIDYNRKDMVVLNDGRIFFAAMLREINNAKPDRADWKNIIVGVTYNTAGNWSIEKIADHSGLWMGLTDDKGTSVGKSSGCELQLSKTADENALVAKWVEIFNVSWPSETTYQYQGGDVIFSTKLLNGGSGKWSDTVNVTANILEPDIEDRNVWIPNILPNDLHKVPAVQLFTIPQGEELTSQEQRLYLSKQHVKFSQFDAIGVASADDKSISAEFTATISPNPARDRAELSFTAPRPGKVSVEIFNSFGESVLAVFEGETTETLNAIELKLGSLPSGAYFVRVQAGDAVTTEKLNLIR